MKKSKQESTLFRISNGVRSSLILLMCIIFANVSAQNKSVSGTVIDETGVPLPGANIIVDGTSRGTQSDFDGNYTIEVTPKETLTFSYVGMKAVSVLVGNQTTINVTLKMDSSLDEVVVVGYGSRKKMDLIGSVTSVNADEMTKVATSDIGEMLRGQAAGVQISLNDSGPGGTSNILIRGKNTVNGGNDPLVIVDGVPVGAINDINPNDIESLNILKDASALAIYGARASNGVILITTKRGKNGRTSVSYNGSTALQTINRNFDIYSGDEFAQLKREAYRTDNGAYLDDSAIFSPVELASVQSGNYINWEKLILRTGITHNHNLSVTTGTENTSIFSSVNIFNQEGVVDNSDFNRITGRVNVDQKINDWLKIGANVSMQYSRENTPGGTMSETGGAGVGNIILTSITTSPLGSVYNEDGSLKAFPGDFVENVNPLVDLREVNTLARNRNDIMNLFADISLFEGFNYRLNLSRRSWNNKESSYSTANSLEGIRKNNQGQGRLKFQDNVEWQWENILTYSTDFGESKHKMDLTAVQSMTESNYTRLYAEYNNLPNDILGIYGLEAAESTQNYVSANRRSLVSGVFRAEYNYDSRYYFQAAMRADASSIFGANNKWGYFPSVGVSWNASNESFLTDVEEINNLKLSLSYGSIGNQGPSPYQSIATADQREYLINGIKVSGYVPGSRLSNPDLRWETTTNLNARLDFGFFHRLTGTIEYYKARTKDLFFDRSLPASSGYADQKFNIGEVENQGIEISMNGDLVKTKDLKVNLGVSFTKNVNKIITLGGIDGNGDGKEDDDVANRLFIGRPIDVNYQLMAIGIWQEGEDIANGNMASFGDDIVPGTYKLLDADGDGVVEVDDDRVITEQTPDWFGSFFLNAEYKGLDLSANVITVQGVDKYNAFRSGYTEGGSLRGIKNGIKQNYWLPENPGGDFPRPMEQNDTPFLYTNAIQDASFIRLQNVTLGYSLPSETLSSLGLNKLRVYVTGSNLITITDFQSFSPEKNPNDYPEAVTILAGIQVGL
ncbi:TonB-dependent receptor [Yeosuana marina]|uniref:SusC/RagA family TonB-linked outer membrane protein n=1 Tax=Yeosuana marina TaxID=1565536 RepID=UPI0030C8AA85